MRSLHSVAALVILTAVTAPPAPAAPSPPAVTVTVHDRAVPFRTALDDLFRHAQLRHVVEPAVPNSPVTLDLRDVPFMQAFRALLRQAGAVYRIEQSGAAQEPVYVIGTLAAPAARDAGPRVDVRLPEKRVTLDLKDVTLRRALQTLFEDSGFQHAVEPTVPNDPITLSVHDVPFTEALRQLMNLAPGAAFRREGHIYVIGTRTPALVELELPAGAAEKMSIEGDHLIQSASRLDVS